MRDKNSIIQSSYPLLIFIYKEIIFTYKFMHNFLENILCGKQPSDTESFSLHKNLHKSYINFLYAYDSPSFALSKDISYVFAFRTSKDSIKIS